MKMPLNSREILEFKFMEFMTLGDSFTNTSNESSSVHDLVLQVKSKFHFSQKKSSSTLTPFVLFIGLTKQLLNFTLNKHYTLQCSDWEAENLTEAQKSYAARDAIASVGICLQLIADTAADMVDSHWKHFYNLESIYFTWARTVRLVDTKFHIPSSNKGIFESGEASKDKRFTPTKPKKYLHLAIVYWCPIYKLKLLFFSSSSTRAYAARKSHLYDNAILQAPDGQTLCTCDQKKALWKVLIIICTPFSNKNSIFIDYSIFQQVCEQR